MPRRLFAIAALTLACSAQAQTTQINPDRYRVESGVAFELRTAGISHFLFEWTDSSGSFIGLDDVTLEIVAGETYSFQRIDGSHPFAICNDTLPVDGTDGEYFRTTFSSAVINAATLTPIADFTADPGPTTDMIVWTPSAADVGTYYYTCVILGHPDMTGRIDVIEASADCLPDVNGDGMVTPTDFTAWINAFNNNLPECDQNGDNACTPTDFTAWIANFNAGC
ncbi:MAG: hypothetical protein Phyf2KO_03290 [Phycisphaerales bacterium]